MNARAGYRFHKYLAAEVEYEWLQHFGMRVEGVELGSMRSSQTITANLKAIAPYGHWQPYVLARVRRDARQIQRDDGLAAQRRSHQLLHPLRARGWTTT